MPVFAESVYGYLVTDKYDSVKSKAQYIPDAFLKCIVQKVS